jgi:hypothetical protein
MKTAIIASLTLLSLTAPAMAVTTEQFQFRGDSAFASFSQFDGCISTFVNVDAFNNVSKSAPGAPSEEKGAFLSYSIFNFCTGIGYSGFGSTKDVNLTINNSLQSASLSGNIPVFDFSTGTNKTATVNLNWTATGDASRSKSQNSFQSPNFRSISRSVGTTREASVTGNVVLDGTDLTTNLSSFGSLNSSNNGSIIFSRK